MSPLHPHQRQCRTCGEYIDYKAPQCVACGAVQRKIRDLRPELDEEAKEEFHKKKLVAMHVPPWLKAVIEGVNFCQEEPRVHQGVRLSGGAGAVVIVYSAFYWINYAAGNYFPMEKAWVRLPLALPCLIAFYLGYHYFFRAFYVILEAVAEVMEVEKKAYVWQGVQKEKSRHKRAAKTEHPVKAGYPVDLKLPAAIRPFDEKKDEEQRQLDAIHRALEE